MDLSTMRFRHRIAAVCGAAMLIPSATGCSGTGHSESWKWGHDHAGDAAQLLPNGTSPESACRGTAGMYITFGGSEALGTMNPPTDKDEAVAGCLAGLKDMGKITG